MSKQAATDQSVDPVDAESCAECSGSQVCPVCDGTCIEDGDECSECQGSGDCHACRIE